MRKSQRAAIHDYFSKANVNMDNINTTYSIDGGYLLHCVVWDREETFRKISDKFVQYIRAHFGQRVTTVFHGYTDSKNNSLITTPYGKNSGIF